MNYKNSRRKFIYQTAITALGIPLLGAGTCNDNAGKNQRSNNKKLGVALVGLGGYATGQLGPALLQTEHCYLAGIVTGTALKIPAWKAKYNIPDKNIYSYDTYDEIANNPDIDIIYVVLPNHMHAEYSIRGSKAGKHVICEKPMALNVAECDAMIAAAKQAKKNLSIGYRLHFDPYHQEMTRMVKEKVYGDLKSVDTAFSIMPQKGSWRLDKKIAGGGPLMDVGIYCLQAACYTTGLTPAFVTAHAPAVSDTTKFLNVEETLDFKMEMPGGIVASCHTSYSENNNLLKINGQTGWAELKPAFSYGGLKMTTSDDRSFSKPAFSQQAAQMDGIAVSIKNRVPSIVPSEMGRRDMQIIEAIYEAMESGKRVGVKY